MMHMEVNGGGPVPHPFICSCVTGGEEGGWTVYLNQVSKQGPFRRYFEHLPMNELEAVFLPLRELSMASTSRVLPLLRCEAPLLMITCEKGLGFRPAWGFCQVCVPAVPCVQVTGELSVEPPLQLPGLRGGIFSDEPGLGKTVTALSLILKTQVGLLGAGRWRGFGGVDVCVVTGSARVHACY